MWVFTTIGFFSAVKVKDEHAEELKLNPARAPWLMVRARVREDLVNLLDVCKQLGAPEPEILQWKGRDYPYRVIIPRRQWEMIMEHLCSEIDYPNFKGEVTKTQGWERHVLYGRVWGVMNGAERWLALEEIKEEERRKRYRDNPLLPFDPEDPGPDGSFGFSFGSSDHLDSIMEQAKRGSRRGGRRRGKGKKKKR